MKIPEGWPTDVMIEVGANVVAAAGNCWNWNEASKAAEHVFKSMYEHAPTPPASPTTELTDEKIAAAIEKATGELKCLDSYTYEDLFDIIRTIEAMSKSTPPSPSRTEFERLIKERTPTAQCIRADNGEYIVPVIQTMWQGYRMAMPGVITRKCAKCGHDWHSDECVNVAPAAQEAEPVAWMDRSGRVIAHRVRAAECATSIVAEQYNIPLYTRPTNDKLRQAAEELLLYMDNPERIHRVAEYMPLVENIRAELEGKS